MSLRFDQGVPRELRFRYGDGAVSQRFIELLVEAKNAAAVRAFPGNGDALRLDTEMTNLLYVNLPKKTLHKAEEALMNLRKGKTYAELSEERRSALEAIHYVTGRPSFRLEDGKLDQEPPPNWVQLIDHLKSFKRIGNSVGRIEIGGPGGGYVGTGIVIDERLILTNRHVAKLFCRNVETDHWSLEPNCRPRIAFGWEQPHTPTLTAPLTRLVWVEQESAIDFAILATETPLPPPIPLEIASIRFEEPVYCIGFPGDDPNVDRAIKQRLFGGTFGVKRLAPGRIRDPQDINATLAPSDRLHDCTTLGNSSGSCVMRLATHEMIALHYSGAQHFVNLGVSAATIELYRDRWRAAAAQA